MGVDAPTYPTYIIAEDHKIAAPIIEHYSLRRDDSLGRFRAFAGDSLLLAESRGDSLRAAALVGLVLGRYGHDEHTRVFHLGMAWERTMSELEGELVLVNRVVDGASGRSFLPDILLRHELREAAVETTTNGGSGDDPASAGPDDPERTTSAPGLCDRELAGVFAAALALLSPHQVYGLAAVEPRRGGACAADIVRRSLPALERLFGASAGLFRPAHPRIDAAVRSLLDELVERLRLTAAQRSQLERLAEAASARGEDLTVSLREWREGPQVTSKQERRKRFDELKRHLSE